MTFLRQIWCLPFIYCLQSLLFLLNDLVILYSVYFRSVNERPASFADRRFNRTGFLGTLASCQSCFVAPPADQSAVSSSYKWSLGRSSDSLRCSVCVFLFVRAESCGVGAMINYFSSWSHCRVWRLGSKLLSLLVPTVHAVQPLHLARCIDIFDNCTQVCCSRRGVIFYQLDYRLLSSSQLLKQSHLDFL